jgi:hypothetical protein
LIAGPFAARIGGSGVMMRAIGAKNRHDPYEGRVVRNSPRR